MTETILIILGYIVFHIVLLVGLILIPIGLSGTFIIVADVLVFSLFDKFDRIPIWLIIVFFIVSVLGEVVEYLSSVVGTKKFGASNLSIVLMFVFMIVGGLVGASFTFGIGAMFGAIIGAFVGALVGELISKKNLRKALKAGTGAFLGKMTAWIVKISIGVVMVVISVILIWIKF